MSEARDPPIDPSVKHLERQIPDTSATGTRPWKRVLMVTPFILWKSPSRCIGSLHHSVRILAGAIVPV